MLRIEDVFASYGKKEILHGVSFEVKEGEIVSLIGPNGAGKSTLLKAIAGLLPLKEGEIFFRRNGNEVPLSKVPSWERINSGMGFFLQGGKVFPNLTVSENIEISGIGMEEEERKNNINWVLKIFPVLKEKWDIRAGLLSGGQRQMLALAMSLLKRPGLLLLDEPSAGLAPKFVKEILNKVKKLNEDEGITMLVVEQNVREVLEISHRTVFLQGGKVVEKKPSSQVTREELEMLFFGKM